AFMLSIDKGAATTLHCATSQEAATETALYYDACKPARPSRLAQDRVMAQRLWAESERWVQQSPLCPSGSGQRAVLAAFAGVAPSAINSICATVLSTTAVW